MSTLKCEKGLPLVAEFLLLSFLPELITRVVSLFKGAIKSSGEGGGEEKKFCNFLRGLFICFTWKQFSRICQTEKMGAIRGDEEIGDV